MKISLIVDGQAESQALPGLLRRIQLPQGVRLLNPIYADMQPKASPDQIARAAIDRMKLVRNQKADRTIVLIDLENQEERGMCAPSFAESVQQAFTKKKVGNVQVIIKNRKFENWLIADPDALLNMRARFSISKKQRSQIEPNLADSISDATELLNRMVKQAAYHKRKDPVIICQKVDPLKVAANSRSFRKFLRAVGHATYKNQSHKPA
ncbi:MAG: DUF4276 family protein [bacterium]|nr:DUF4276 family protein [bacterium]